METEVVVDQQRSDVTMEPEAPDVSRNPADDAAAAARGFLERLQRKLGDSTTKKQKSMHLQQHAVSKAESLSCVDGSDKKGSRVVRFDLAAITKHEVIAYSEIYGMHPREFVFGKNFSIEPSAGARGFVSLNSLSEEEVGSDDSDSDEFDPEFWRDVDTAHSSRSDDLATAVWTFAPTQEQKQLYAQGVGATHPGAGDTASGGGRL